MSLEKRASRRRFLKIAVSTGALAAAGYSLINTLSAYLPEVAATKSDQVITPTPALVYSNIDGKFTDMNELKLTPLGEQLVAQDKRWMPTHEWTDALVSPQTLYGEPSSLTEGNAYLRMKYYEKGWIDSNRWLDVLVDHVADPSVSISKKYFFTDNLYACFNPSLDYTGNARGDYIFNLTHFQGKSVRLLYWKGPFTSGYWTGDAPQSLAIGNSDVGISPDFPQLPSHLIYEMRINLDALGYPRTSISPEVRIGDSFGFSITVDDFGADVTRRWPKEFAQNGTNQSAHGTSIIPTYSGTCKLAVQPIDEFSELLGNLFLGGTMGTTLLLLRKIHCNK